MNDRDKLIEQTLKKEGIKGLKKINATNDEICKAISDIDKEVDLKKIEQILTISKELEYDFPLDYCMYYSKQTNLRIKPNLFKVDNEEMVIDYLFSMDKDSRIYIMKAKIVDSKYEDELVPFVELAFGDFLCFDKKDDSIVYFSHEEDTIAKVSDNWTNFVKTLHQK